METTYLYTDGNYQPATISAASKAAALAEIQHMGGNVWLAQRTLRHDRPPKEGERVYSFLVDSPLFRHTRGDRLQVRASSRAEAASKIVEGGYALRGLKLEPNATWDEPTEPASSQPHHWAAGGTGA